MKTSLVVKTNGDSWVVDYEKYREKSREVAQKIETGKAVDFSELTEWVETNGEYRGNMNVAKGV